MLLCPFMFICGKLPSGFHHALKKPQYIPEAKQGHGKRITDFSRKPDFGTRLVTLTHLTVASMTVYGFRCPSKLFLNFFVLNLLEQHCCSVNNLRTPAALLQDNVNVRYMIALFNS